jgi:hypothetical protein
MPELERLLSDLVAKTASATERTSDMASQALVHIACHTPIGPRCVSQVLLEFKSYDAVCDACWVSCRAHMVYLWMTCTTIGNGVCREAVGALWSADVASLKLSWVSLGSAGSLVSVSKR